MAAPAKGTHPHLFLARRPGREATAPKIMAGDRSPTPPVVGLRDVAEASGSKSILSDELPLSVGQVLTEGRPKKRQRTVRFDGVKVYNHEPALVGDRVPSDYGPGIGLGPMVGIQVRRVNSYEAGRLGDKAVRRIDADERRARLLPIARAASIDAVALEASVVRMQREETNMEDPRSDSPLPPVLSSSGGNGSSSSGCSGGSTLAPIARRPQGGFISLISHTNGLCEDGQDGEAEVGVSDLW